MTVRFWEENSKKMFFGGGMGSLIPMRPRKRPEQAEGERQQGPEEEDQQDKGE